MVEHLADLDHLNEGIATLLLITCQVRPGSGSFLAMTVNGRSVRRYPGHGRWEPEIWSESEAFGYTFIWQ